MERAEQQREQRDADVAMEASLYVTGLSNKDNGEEETVQDKEGAANIERIKVSAFLDQKEEKRVQRIKEITERMAAASAKATRMGEGSSEEKKSEAQEVLNDLTKSHDEAKKYLEEDYKQGLEAIQKQAKEAKTVAEIIACRPLAIEHQKTLNQGPMKDWIDHLRKFNQASSTLGRSKTAKPKRSAESRPKTPLFMSLHETITRDVVNVADSIFEAKGGLRPAIMPALNSKKFETLTKVPCLKKAMGSVDKAVKTGSAAVSQPIEGGKASVRKLNQAVEELLGADLRSKYALPRAPWASQVFQMEVVATCDSYATAGWNHYGMITCCVVLAGDVSFWGVPSGKLEGASFADQRANVLRSTVDDLVNVLNSGCGAFFYRFKAGGGPNGECVIVFPSNCLVAWAGKDLRMLRWVISGDNNDNVRVAHALRNLILSFPEFSGPNQAYRPLAEHLGVQVV